MESAVYEIRLKDSFSQGLGRLESGMNKFETKVGGLSNSFVGLGSTIAGAFAGGIVVGGISSLISGLKDIGTEAFNTAREFTNLKDAISFASGDQAEQNIKFLDDTIEKLGLDMQSTYKGFKTFQGALMGTSLEGENGRHIFESVSKAASVMKLSADATEGSFLALGQMISKGTVSAEELRGQLGERLPGAFQIAARAMNMTTADLGKMMQAGKLSAEVFLPRFAEELDRTFGPGVQKAQKSFNANWNRFNNLIERGKIELGNSLIPLINKFISLIPELDFSPLVSVFADLWMDIKGVFGIFSQLVDLFGGSLSTFEALSYVIRAIAFNIRTSLLPIRVFITVYSELMALIKNSLGVFKGLGQVLQGIFTGNFKLVNSGAKQMQDSIINTFTQAKQIGEDFVKQEYEGYSKIFSPFGSGPKATDSSTSKSSSLSSSGRMTSNAATKDIGVEKVQSGTKSVVVNITKLIDKVVFEKGYKESEAKLQEMLTKALLTSVNDVNIVSQ